MNDSNFSGELEKVFKDALSTADRIIAEANAIKEEAIRKKDEAVEIHRKAERESETLHEKYFEERKKELIEAGRIEQMRQLVYHHLSNGATVDEVEHWLRVPNNFIEQIKEVMERANKFNSTAPIPELEGHPKIKYDNQGRGGYVEFSNDKTQFRLWWEFAASPAVVIMEIPSEPDWVKRTGLPMEQRNDVLKYIGAIVVRDQLSSGGEIVIGEQVMTFYGK